MNHRYHTAHTYHTIRIMLRSSSVAHLRRMASFPCGVRHLHSTVLTSAPSNLTRPSSTAPTSAASSTHTAHSHGLPANTPPRASFSTPTQVGAPLRKKVTSVDLINMKRKGQKISSSTTQHTYTATCVSRETRCVHAMLNVCFSLLLFLSSFFVEW